MAFSADIYGSWREKQLEKYDDLFPRLKPHLKGGSLLDIGIGKAWLEEFLESKGIKFNEVIGVDADEKMTLPQRNGITYFITDDFETSRKFDLVVCFDTLHLLKDARKLTGYSQGLALVSLPIRLREKLEVFNGENIIEQGEIGGSEKDYFMLIKVFKS
jgi:SAM-dependent methyltransferase